MVIFTSIKKEELEQKFKNKALGYSSEKIKTIHEEGRWRKKIAHQEVTLTLYSSGKLLLQGKKEAVQEAAEELERLHLGEKEKTPRFTIEKEMGLVIGSDESLKGDTFGGLVVAAVKADEKLRKQLQEIGVKDSKKLSDKEIILMAEKVRKTAPCEVKCILPEEYNHYLKNELGGNITSLLNKLHQDCARDLLPGIHVVDQYPGCTVGNIREQQAESKYLEVAAASVLARSAALQQLDYLSKLACFPLPKGSTHVRVGLLELKKRGLDFKRFVKLDFRNVRDFLKE